MNEYFSILYARALCMRMKTRSLPASLLPNAGVDLLAFKQTNHRLPPRAFTFWKDLKKTGQRRESPFPSGASPAPLPAGPPSPVPGSPAPLPRPRAGGLRPGTRWRHAAARPLGRAARCGRRGDRAEGARGGRRPHSRRSRTFERAEPPRWPPRVPPHRGPQAPRAQLPPALPAPGRPHPQAPAGRPRRGSRAQPAPHTHRRRPPSSRVLRGPARAPSLRAATPRRPLPARPAALQFRAGTQPPGQGFRRKK